MARRHPPPPRSSAHAVLPLLLAALPALAAASFLPPVFSDAGATERPVAHAASGSSVFALTTVSAGSVNGNYFVTRYDAADVAPVWRKPAILGPAYSTYLSLDGGSVLLYFVREGEEALLLLELDAETGEGGGVSVADASWGNAGVKGTIYRVNGEVAAFLERSDSLHRVLPSGVELPDEVWLNGDEVAYLGDGKFAFMVTSAEGISLRVVDAVNGVYESQRFDTPNPGFFPNVDIYGANGFVYFLWIFTQSQVPNPRVQVAKLKQETMEVLWQRDISYNLPRDGTQNSPLRCGFSISANDGIVGVSLTVELDPSPDVIFSVEGVELSKPQIPPPSPALSGFEGDEAVVIALDDSDGITLSVANTGTVGTDSCFSGGGSMLSNGVYALLGPLDVTDVGNVDLPSDQRLPTGRSVAFFTDVDEECD